MKKILIINILCFYLNSNAQIVLNVPTVFQQQDQWCWAGSTKSVLDYYGNTFNQCQIAEYTRTVAVWHNFGATNCCTNPTLGCNYWNYNWGYAGSMQDILQTLGSITNSGVGSILSMNQVTTEISAGRPFIIRWGWVSGGGHFIVGKGFDGGNNIYYMNPWPGEGSKVSTYAWMQSDGSHIWTSTNMISTNPPFNTSINSQIIEASDLSVFPNPAGDYVIVKNNNRTVAKVFLYDIHGKLVLENDLNSELNLNTSAIARGIYIMKISSKEACFFRKIVLN